MKITKYVHSCLLIEDDVNTIVDPGIFSYKSGLFNLADVDRIDEIVVTHIHPDHLDPEFVKQILDKFPDVAVIGPAAVKTTLSEAGLDLEVSESSKSATRFEAPHENLPVLGAPVPDNYGYHVGNVSHPGDSHTFSESKEVLALPVMAPWGNPRDAVKLAIKLEPKHVIPIHDWNNSEAGQDWFYGVLTRAFEDSGIVFHPVKNGEAVEISL